MLTLVFDSVFIQAILLRICFCFVFAVLAVAAQSEENAISPELEISTIENLRALTDLTDTSRFGPEQLRSEQLRPEPQSQEDLGSEHPGYHHLPVIGVFIRSDVAIPLMSGYDNTPHVAVMEKELWPTSERWQITQGSDRLSFSPQLRFESKNQRLEIKPRRNSLRFLWRKSFK